MAEILFKLKGVPEEEANEVRELLDSNHIAYYETPGGIFGISMAAIWLKDDTQLMNAQALMDDYHKARELRVKEEYEVLKKSGKLETTFDKLRQDPIQFAMYIAAILIILYFTVKPFFYFGD